jgi:hypothetical protein
MQTTFVTAFLALKDARTDEVFIESCFQHFLKLTSTEIYIHCFLSPELYTAYSSRLPILKSVIYSITTLEDTFAHKDLEDLQYSLPAIRSTEKDTDGYMKLMNAKIEFVQKAMGTNYFKTSQFAWIDFRICHVLDKCWPVSLTLLKKAATLTLNRQKVVFPGCWSKGTKTDQLASAINWRFCGGFFMGSRAALEEMSVFTRTHYRKTVEKYGTLAWEVNLWHRFELDSGFNVDWFSGDHNERILQIPEEWFTSTEKIEKIFKIHSH